MIGLPPLVVAPPVYYAPPPVLYAPPQTYYAPPSGGYAAPGQSYPAPAQSAAAPAPSGPTCYAGSYVCPTPAVAAGSTCTCATRGGGYSYGRVGG